MEGERSRAEGERSRVGSWYEKLLGCPWVWQGLSPAQMPLPGPLEGGQA